MCFTYVLALLLVSKCSATWHGAVSTQYTVLDPHSHSYSYGYADPNSQKHETRTHDGVTRGSYSYVDGSGHLQSVSYTADPHHGFHAFGTNLPKTPVTGLGYNAGVAYRGNHAYPQAHLILNHNGVPVDTPEVQHAKTAHAAAYSAAAAAAAADGHHHLYKRSLWNYGYGAHSIGPVALTAAGVPVDTPDVQAAKAEHAAAHAKVLSATAHSGAGAGTYGGSYGGSHGSYHVPVLTHNGVPVDTPEVQHARSTHFVALAKVTAEGGPGGDDGSYHGQNDSGSRSSYSAGFNAGYGADGAHAEGTSYSTSAHHVSSSGYKGPLHYPVLQNGVPVEPAEVQHARSAHLSALAAESSKSSTNGGYNDGNKYSKW